MVPITETNYIKLTNEEERLNFIRAKRQDPDVYSLGIKIISSRDPYVYFTVYISQGQYEGTAEENYLRSSNKLIIMGEGEGDLPLAEGDIPHCEGTHMSCYGVLRGSTSKPFIVTKYESVGVDYKFAHKLFSQICKK